MAADLPTSAAITSATVTNAQQKLNLGAIATFLLNLLGNDSSDKPAARAALGALGYGALPGTLHGCTMSTAGSSATMSIAAGFAQDSTNAFLMVLPAIAKTTASWAVGTTAGGKSQTGAIANNTWYHFYVIRRPDTSVVDVAFSTNAAGLAAADFVVGGGNIPDAYTQFRYIGSGLINGSAQWTSFFQFGDEFMWVLPVLDVDSATVAAASTLYAMTVPLGIKTQVLMQGFKLGASGMINVWSADNGAIGASVTASPLGVLYTDGSSPTSVGQFKAYSNTARQIYIGATAGSQTLRLVTLGYVNTRGRVA